MFITLKALHFLALLLGGAGSVTPAIAARVLKHIHHKGPPPPALAITLRMIAIGALFAIILLWITGLGMYAIKYPGTDLGIWFLIKLIAATFILIISIWVNLMAARAARTQRPPNATRMRRLGLAARGLLILAIIAAVLTFGRM